MYNSIESKYKGALPLMKKDFSHGTVLKLTRYDTPETITRDFSLMKENGIDTVVIWPAAFYWEEKKEGYPFNTGKTVLELAERFGLKIIMELAGQLTVMEYIPDWKMKPEYYAYDNTNHRKMGQSSFGYLNYYHPEVNELICKHYNAAAKAYKDFPALLGYDIFNETMFSSYDKYSLGEFRNWLKNKYGTLERLNEVWERTYSDWEQIDVESWKWMSVMPEADYSEFRRLSIGIILRKWKKAVTDIDSKHMIIADNIHAQTLPGAAYARPQDDFDLKEAVGEIGMSFYPKQISGTRPDPNRWQIFDSFYAASKREGFYISEMQTHIQALFNYNTCCRPYELKRWCYEAYAAGAKGLIWWMWRPFDKGLQTLGRGLVDYKGRSTERLAQAHLLSKTFAEYGTLIPVRSKVGILYDTACDDLHRPLTNTYKLDKDIYLCSVHGAYKAFYDADVRADIVTINEINSYNTVVLTNNIVMDDTRAKALTTFVENGGTLIIDGRFGIITPFSQLSEMLPGGAMNRLCGQEFLDSDYEGLDYNYGDISVMGHFGRDLMSVTDGEVLGSFGDGYPAIVRKTYGKGKVLFFNTQLFYGYYLSPADDTLALIRKLAEELSLEPLNISGNVHARVAKSDGKVLFFIFNYENTDEYAEVSCKIDGRCYKATATVAANDSVIVEGIEI